MESLFADTPVDKNQIIMMQIKQEDASLKSGIHPLFYYQYFYSAVDAGVSGAGAFVFFVFALTGVSGAP